jgi:hypothetical protein
MPQLPKYQNSDAVADLKVAWKDKGKVQTCIDLIQSNFEARLQFVKDVGKECVTKLLVLQGTLEQLKKQANTQNFSLDSARKLRMDVKALAEATETGTKNYFAAMEAWRGFPIQNILDQKAVGKLQGLRVLQQNADKLTDGLEKAVKAAEAKASALFKQISAISDAYGEGENAAETFLEKATAMHKKADLRVNKDGGVYVLKLKSALDRVVRNAGDKKLDDKVVQDLNNTFADVEKQEVSLDAVISAAGEMWKAMIALRDKCPGDAQRKKIMTLETEVKGWFDNCSKQREIQAEHSKAAAVVKKHDANKKLDKFPACKLT